mmetsp:Transcript_90610/g.216339  ORF Transcript_90610/g.216339 Transcript_90610/m.216339 type:complete len:213 (-) Transcript_90610:262-900(-)
MVVHEEQLSTGVIVLQAHPEHPATPVVVRSHVLAHILHAMGQQVPNIFPVGKADCVRSLQNVVNMQKPNRLQGAMAIFAFLKANDVKGSILLDLGLHELPSALTITLSDSVQIPPEEVVGKNLNGDVAHVCVAHVAHVAHITIVAVVAKGIDGIDGIDGVGFAVVDRRSRQVARRRPVTPLLGHRHAAWNRAFSWKVVVDEELEIDEGRVAC